MHHCLQSLVCLCVHSESSGKSHTLCLFLSLNFVIVHNFFFVFSVPACAHLCHNGRTQALDNTRSLSLCLCQVCTVSALAHRHHPACPYHGKSPRNPVPLTSRVNFGKHKEHKAKNDPLHLFQVCPVILVFLMCVLLP